MTIRRWLKKPDSTTIPTKYQLHFQRLATIAEPVSPESLVSSELPVSFDHLLDDLHVSGRELKNLSKFKKDLAEKLKDKRIAGDFLGRVKTVSRAAFNNPSLKTKTICLGALLYLVNPFDFIPDSLGVVGYLDDFAVITMVYERFLNSKS